MLNILVLFNYYYNINVDKKNLNELVNKINTNFEVDYTRNYLELKDKKIIKVNNINTLLKENDDIFAWLEIEGTNIDYPVMKYEEYLYKDLKKNYSLSGTPFLDANCNLKFENNVHIIHGHNMNNGTMFNNLLNYKDKQFFEGNKYIKLYTKNVERIYKVYAISKLNILNEKDLYFYKNINFHNDKDFYDYIQKIDKNFILKSNELPKITNILVLSTCDNSNDNNRIVVFALEQI